MCNERCRNWSSCKLVLIVLGVNTLIGMFSYGIISGPISAATYVAQRNERQLYTVTECLLLNYTVNQHSCETCDVDFCSRYECFDERFEVSYKISNGTKVTSIFAPNNQKNRHQQQQINASYECFHRKEDAVFVIWEPPNERKELIKLCIGFAFAGLPIVLIIICCFVLMIDKILKNCSCTSIIYRIGKRVRHPLETQSTATINTSTDMTMTTVF